MGMASKGKGGRIRRFHMFLVLFEGGGGGKMLPRKWKRKIRQRVGRVLIVLDLEYDCQRKNLGKTQSSAVKKRARAGGISQRGVRNHWCLQRMVGELACSPINRSNR